MYDFSFDNWEELQYDILNTYLFEIRLSLIKHISAIKKKKKTKRFAMV